MADFETIVSILGFIVISHIVLVSGGGGDFLFNLPPGTQPPQLIPQETNIGFREVELEDDAFSHENISFVEYRDINNPSYELGYRGLTNSSTVAVLETGESSGTILYNTPGVQSVEVLASKKCGGFFQSSRMSIVSEQPGDSPDRICGEVDANVEADINANFVRFNFLPPSQGGGTPEIYFFRWSKVRQTQDVGDNGFIGMIAGGLDNIGELVSYPVRLWDYFEHFPLYIRIFYGGILAYLSIVIIRGL